MWRVPRISAAQGCGAFTTKLLRSIMGNIPKDVAQLHAQTQDSRYQFLKMELLTCFNAIDFGKAELERGERELAATEIRNAKKGCATIRRFLAGLDSET